MSESIGPVVWHELNPQLEEALRIALKLESDHSDDEGLLEIWLWQDEEEDKARSTALLWGELVSAGYLRYRTMNPLEAKYLFAQSRIKCTTSAGRTYFIEKERRQKIADDLKAEEERIRKDDRKHNWKIAIVSSVLGGVAGGIAGYLSAQL